MHFEFGFFFKASYWAVFRFFGKPKIYIFCQLSEETPKERNSSSCFVFHWAGMRRQNCAICCAAKTSKTLLHKSLYWKSICIKSTILLNYSYNALNFQKVKYKQYIFGKSILPAFFWEEVRRPIMKFLPRQVVLYLYYLYYSGTAAALPLAVRHNKKGGGDEDALIATNLDDNIWKGNDDEEDKAWAGGVQEGATWLDREIGHNLVPGPVTKFGHKFCDQFQRQPRTAGNFTNPTVAHRIDHHNLKAVAMLTDLFSWDRNYNLVDCSAFNGTNCFLRAAAEVVSVKFLICRWNHSEYCLNFAPRQFPTFKWKFPGAKVSL